MTGGDGFGTAVLVSPRLLLAAARVFFEGDTARSKLAFRYFNTSTNIIGAWKINNCAFAELEQDLQDCEIAVIGLTNYLRGFSM